MSEDTNPLWDAWLRAHIGRRPPTYEFLIWNSQMWRRYEREHGLPEHGPHDRQVRADYAAWLDRQVNALRPVVA